MKHLHFCHGQASRVFLGDGRPPTLDRNPYFMGTYKPLRNWVDEFIPYYMEMSWGVDRPDRTFVTMASWVGEKPSLSPIIMEVGKGFPQDDRFLYNMVIFHIHELEMGPSNRIDTFQSTAIFNFRVIMGGRVHHVWVKRMSCKIFFW